MGAPRKLRKKYRGPQHPYNAERFEEELSLIGVYGLRNKREIWKVRTRIGNFRQRARSLLALEPDDPNRVRDEQLIIDKLIKLGVMAKENISVENILNLKPENFLERRLQTVVFRRGLARSPHQARQLITHGHIALNTFRINVPSYHLKDGEEENVDYAPTSPYISPDHPVRISLVDKVEEREEFKEEEYD
ncbi:MAG: 30S ribosomal protein S4 [Candidatus Hodarchaeales archaeon]|jgi:small subunit ribosomal protein S4